MLMVSTNYLNFAQGELSFRFVIPDDDEVSVILFSFVFFSGKYIFVKLVF